MASVRMIPMSRAAEEQSEDPNSTSKGEDEDDEEESSSDGEDASTPMSPRSATSFERITPVIDTPWHEFFMTMASLTFWGALFAITQMCWIVKQKDDVNKAFLPVSLLLVPIAVWRLKGSRHLGHPRTHGLEAIAKCALQHNGCLRAIFMGTRKDVGGPDATLQQQIRWLDRRPKPQGGARFLCGFTWCALFFWVLIVGHTCWPVGYLYLVTYSFRRCQASCDMLKPHTGEDADKQDAWITLSGNGTYTRENLEQLCDQGMGRDPPQHPLELVDLHWFLPPRGAWVVAAPLQRNLSYNASNVLSYKASDMLQHSKAYKTFSDKTFNSMDCDRLSVNAVILVMIGVFVLLVAFILVIPSGNGVFVIIVTTGASLLCVAGIFSIWLFWVQCRWEKGIYNDANLVFGHILDSCLLVTKSNSSHYAECMQSFGTHALQYESNYRHVHKVARTEVWFGSLAEAFLLALVVAAHSAYRHKVMQTREARYELLYRRPKLVICLLQHTTFLDHLPPHPRTLMALTLQRTYDKNKEQFKDLKDEVDKMLQMEPSPSDDAGVGAAISFCTAAGYALVRALIPSFHRQVAKYFDGEVRHAVSQDNSLWLCSAVLGIANQTLVYMFVLYQIKEAVRHYSMMMQAWHIFDSLWNFPSQHTLSGDVRMEIVQVKNDGHGETLRMLKNNHEFIGNFSSDHAPSTDHSKEDIVDASAVKDKLPIWWAWREYLIVDFTDRRVQLEIHLVVALMVLVTSASYLLFDRWTERLEIPDTKDIEDVAQWFGGHVGSTSLQIAWDLLFVTPPVISAISCAAAMNRILQDHLKKVQYIQELLDLAADAASPKSPKSNAESADEVEASRTPTAVQSIFRSAKAEQDSHGGSTTRLFGIVTIDRKTLGIAGTLLSMIGGGQYLNIIHQIVS